MITPSLGGGGREAQSDAALSPKLVAALASSCRLSTQPMSGPSLGVHGGDCFDSPARLRCLSCYGIQAAPCKDRLIIADQLLEKGLQKPPCQNIDVCCRVGPSGSKLHHCHNIGFENAARLQSAAHGRRKCPVLHLPVV